MSTLLLKRIALAIPNIIGVVIVTFIMARLLPGDPAAFFAGPTADTATIERMRGEMNLDKPIPEQMLIYVGNLAHGDFGRSFVTGNAVLTDILQRLPASLELAMAALVIAVVVAIPLGILAANAAGSWYDRIFCYVTSATAALPTFFVGLVLLYVFYNVLAWVPAPTGRLPIFASTPKAYTGFLLIDSLIAGKLTTFYAALSQLALPAISLALSAVAPLARLTRSLMIDTLSSDFIIAARAHGLSPFKVMFGYALQNILMSLLNILGMIFSFLVGATVLVERIYGWPGIGSYAVQAVLSSDYAAVQGFVFAVATLYIIVNLLIDILAIIVDPRVRSMA
ncbi:ABC transporter permease [Agrobacterium arsenijevicii]|uniref:Peptide ABC transporter permease n=1 Tax=Agrobacterium arsenijevicii TaxID=1585697 RepID=A0ABR5D0T9_9HYPH|nr:peptide ABC transporter permease [Agrobacterium arsenijevicii]